MTIKFDGGLTLSISVSNLDRSIDWYRDLFQGELLYRLDDIAWCEISSPTQRVNLGLSQVEEVKVGGPTPTFGVADIEAAKAELEKRAIRMDGEIMDIPGLVRLLTFYDPDDNSLMFYQELANA